MKSNMEKMVYIRDGVGVVKNPSRPRQTLILRRKRNYKSCHQQPPQQQQRKKWKS